MCLISAEVLIKRINGDGSTGPLAEPLERPAAAATTAPARSAAGVPDSASTA